MLALLLILAENFNGLWVWVLALPVVLALVAGASCFASVRGHWAGPVAAAPAVGLGGLLFLADAMGRGPCAVLLLALLPAALGVLSIGLWAENRNRPK